MEEDLSRQIEIKCEALKHSRLCGRMGQRTWARKGREWEKARTNEGRPCRPGQSLYISKCSKKQVRLGFPEEGFDINFVLVSSLEKGLLLGR
jgi:hypothetical protein